MANLERGLHRLAIVLSVWPSGCEVNRLWSPGALGCRTLSFAHPTSPLRPICLHASSHGLPFGRTHQAAPRFPLRVVTFAFGRDARSRHISLSPPVLCRVGGRANQGRDRFQLAHFRCLQCLPRRPLRRAAPGVRSRSCPCQKLHSACRD